MSHQSQKIDKLTPQRARGKGQHMTNIDRERAQQEFLKSFRLNANVTLSCMQAGISRATFYVWQEKDPEFNVLYHQAEAEANDMLLAAAWQRAVKGIERPITSMGKQVFVDGKPLMERVYSDTVLLRLMSWRLPGFSEKTQIEHSGPNGGPMQQRIEIYKVRLPDNGRNRETTKDQP